ARRRHPGPDRSRLAPAQNGPNESLQWTGAAFRRSQVCTYGQLRTMSVRIVIVIGKLDADAATNENVRATPLPLTTSQPSGKPAYQNAKKPTVHTGTAGFVVYLPIPDLAAKRIPHRPGTPRRSVCAPGRCSSVSVR